MNLALIGFILYLVALVAIGVYSAKSSSEGVDSYFLAGRSLNKWVVALSAVASGRSAWLLIGFVGIAYAKGIAAVWAAHPEAALVYTHYDKIDGADEANAHPVCPEVPDDQIEAMLRGNFIHSCSLMSTRRALALAVGGLG